MNFRKIFVEVGDLFFYKTLEKELHSMESVLDIGCGSNSPLKKVRKDFYSVGVDIFEPSIKKSKQSKIHDDYKVLDLLRIGKEFKPKSFDAVVALDVVEHFDKQNGEKLIKEMEKIAKKKIIIFTPYGFTQQHLYEDNPFQIHKSGWLPKEFIKRGYKVYGMRGFRFIRGEFATIQYKPWFFWGVVSTISQLLVYKMPRIAYQILAVKSF